MLVATRPTKPRSRSRSARGKALPVALHRLGSFALAKPGTVALVMLFGGGGIAIATNALWLQTERHPLPLFRPAMAPQKRAAAPQAPAAPGVSPVPARPPVRSVELPRAAEPEQKPAGAPKPAAPRPKDPIGDLIGTVGPAPMPPVRPARRKQQAAETPAPSARPGHDAMAALIERSTTSR